ncbi:hypothetical protein EHQ43_10065 [Leptospira bouyouniensis]|uniref:Uncharacterized protein n=1 Tax=Leptospira bouyouniensis TaxID=2484911 RepID=A0A7I0HS72_9LEPT|nr:hypothetical protein [Leptospira bouyouniensis]TGL04980.1 hypothetical protein EHQ43_10065 [Leptospira bouyouniensis]
MSSVIERSNLAGVTEKETIGENFRIVGRPDSVEFFISTDYPENVKLNHLNYNVSDLILGATQDFDYKINVQSYLLHKLTDSSTNRLLFWRDIGKFEISFTKKSFHHELEVLPKIGRIKKPLSVNITYEDGLYFVECEDLDLYDHGETAAKALANFSEYILSNISEFQKTPVAEKHESFIESEKKYKEYFEF